MYYCQDIVRVFASKTRCYIIYCSFNRHLCSFKAVLYLGKQSYKMFCWDKHFINFRTTTIRFVAVCREECSRDTHSCSCWSLVTLIMLKCNWTETNVYLLLCICFFVLKCIQVGESHQPNFRPGLEGGSSDECQPGAQFTDSRTGIEHRCSAEGQVIDQPITGMQTWYYFASEQF